MKNANINHVRVLRQNTTDAEKHSWYFLRAKRLNGYKFRRQHLIQPYIVDFICLSKKIIIECDGSQHLDQQSYDKKRDEFISSKGYKIIRFWNNHILKETPIVLDMILSELEKPSSP